MRLSFACIAVVSCAAVACTSTSSTQSTSAFSVGGQVSGLSGTLVLTDNAKDPLTITSNGAFTFKETVNSGSAYDVSVVTQPAGQTCAVTHGTGTVSDANIVSVAVACSSTAGTTLYNVGGTVSGLISSAGTLVLANGTDQVSLTESGSFTFPTPVATGTAYDVTVKTEPTGWTCALSSAPGTVADANVTSVAVACSANAATLYSVAVTLTGLSASAGTVVLHNGSDSLSITEAGSFTFPTSLATGATYDVSVYSAPASVTCAVTNGSGSVEYSNITNVTVACIPATYSISGTVSGATGALVVSNGATDAPVAASATTFTFSNVAYGSNYALSVTTSPQGQSCSITSTNGSGMISGNVTAVEVTCTNLTYAISGLVSGNTGDFNVTLNVGANAPIVQSVATSATGFSFLGNSGDANYAVTVTSQPAGQVCTVSNGTGTLSYADYTGVSITCSTVYTVSGSFAGNFNDIILSSTDAGTTSLIQYPGDSNQFTIGGFALGDTYDIEVYASSRGQSCTISGTNNSTISTSVTNLVVTCTQNTFSLGGIVNYTDGASPGTVSIVYGSSTQNVTNDVGSFIFTGLTDGENVTLTITPNTCIATAGPSYTVNQANIGIEINCPHP